MKEELIYWILSKGLAKCSTFSNKPLKKWSNLFGNLWFHLDTRHRQIAISNISMILKGSLSSKEAVELARRNFLHLARVFLEIPGLCKITPQNLENFCIYSGIGEIEKALSKGYGVIFLTGHLGNWEWAAMLASYLLPKPLNIIARPLDFKPLERWLNNVRSRNGNKVFPRKFSASHVLKCLRENKIVAILQDQRSSRHEGVVVPFMGKPALTHRAVAILALRSNAAVIPGFSHRLVDGRFSLEAFPALPLIRTGNFKADILANTQMYNTVLERQVRRFPEQWYWIHRRWLLNRTKNRWNVV